jgi:transketolase
LLQRIEVKKIIPLTFFTYPMITASNPNACNAFLREIASIAEQNKRIVIILAGTGNLWPTQEFGNLKKKQQLFQKSACLKDTIELCVKLSLSGHFPYLFAPAAHLTITSFEPILAQLATGNVRMALIGLGPSPENYSSGPAIAQLADIAIFRLFPNTSVFSVSDEISAKALLYGSLASPGIQYIRMPIDKISKIYSSPNDLDLKKGLTHIRKGRDLCIISTGRMLPRALTLARELSRREIEAGVIDLFRIKPLDPDDLYSVISRYTYLCSLEEHFLSGGIGSAVLETLSDYGKSHSIIRLGIDGNACALSNQYIDAGIALELDEIIPTLAEKIW